VHLAQEGGFWGFDTDSGGTNDILGASYHTNPRGIGNYSFELRHPLDTLDDAHDISLKTNDKVGLRLEFDEAYSNGSYIAAWPGIEAYAILLVAPRPTVTCTLDFYTSPSAVGFVIFDGITYSNGQSGGYPVGSYSLLAEVPFGYVFGHWSASESILIMNSTDKSTTAVANASGSITANFQQVQESLVDLIRRIAGDWAPVFTILAFPVALIGVYLVWRRRS
jgi:hypothetical protein